MGRSKSLKLAVGPGHRDPKRGTEFPIATDKGDVRARVVVSASDTCAQPSRPYFARMQMLVLTWCTLAMELLPELGARKLSICVRRSILRVFPGPE